MSILHSARFAGDGTLVATAAEQLRLAVLDTALYPAPVLSSGSAVAKIQHSLIDPGCALPTFGADGRFGPETGGAVARYKSQRGISHCLGLLTRGSGWKLPQRLRRACRWQAFPRFESLLAEEESNELA